MRVGRFLFWMGVIVMFVAVVANVETAVVATKQAVWGYNAGIFISSLLSSLWQGAVLIGIGEIIEKLSN